ncbi:MAG: hypothetical protein Q8T09_18675 [Candidatus Melainabacteria bacterium]|nr:hypothetical protein [Candidatus Melainabacteria bacterium]
MPKLVLLALTVGLILGSNLVVSAQVNQINSVVFGNRIPRFMADPTAGMPVRTTAADFSAMVPSIASAKVIIYSPTGQSFLTVSGDTASLWNATTGVQLMALQHGGPIRWVAFSRDGSFIVTSGGTWTRTWSPNGEFRKQLDHQANVRQMVLSQDGNLIAVTTDENFQLWSASQGLMTLKMPQSKQVISLIFNPDCSQLVTLDGQNAKLWKTVDGAEIGTIAHQYPVRAALFSPDGRYLLCSTEQWTYLWDAKQFIKIADVQYGGGYR